MSKLLLLCWFFLIGLTAQGQRDYSIGGKSIPELQKESNRVLNFGIFSFSFPPLASQKNKSPLTLKQQLLHPYAAADLAFFCRLEVKIEKKLRMPFKFRLGEVQYTEKMEGKN